MVGKKHWCVAVFGLGLGLCSMVQAGGVLDRADAVSVAQYQAAISIWTELANKGDGGAQFNLGLMYHGGLGVERDEQKAVMWYQKAAESGFSTAITYLTVGYEEGWFGLSQNTNKAYYWRGLLGNE